MKRVLILCHGEKINLGHIKPALEANSITYDICNVYRGDILPNDTGCFDGLIIMGGPQHVYGECSKMSGEIDFVRNFIKTSKPVFGVCLGCQILAKIFGGDVYKGKHGFAAGFHAIKLLPTDDIFGNELKGSNAFYWHEDTYSTGSGVMRYAEGHPYIEQAAKFAPNVYGTQFHPEVNWDVILDWTDRCKKAGVEVPPAIANLEALIEKTDKHFPQMHNWLELFLGRLFRHIK